MPQLGGSNMTPQLRASIDILRRHNAWRRGDDGYEMENPTDIGHAIESVCNAAESLAKQLDELQDEMVRMNDTKK